MHRPQAPGMMRVNIMPKEPVPENTEYLPAGPVTIGVEYRYLNADIIVAEFRKQNRPREEMPDPATIATEEGVSIHVMTDVDGELKEYIRFDCLSSGPHYHYICYGQDFPGDTDHSIIGSVDPDAQGEAIPWTLERLRTRLPQMLAFAGRPDLGNLVKGNAQFAEVLPEVRKAAQRASARAETAKTAELRRLADATP